MEFECSPPVPLSLDMQVRLTEGSAFVPCRYECMMVECTTSNGLLTSSGCIPAFSPMHVGIVSSPHFTLQSPFHPGISGLDNGYINGKLQSASASQNLLPKSGCPPARCIECIECMINAPQSATAQRNMEGNSSWNLTGILICTEAPAEREKRLDVTEAPWTRRKCQDASLSPFYRQPLSHTIQHICWAPVHVSEYLCQHTSIDLIMCICVCMHDSVCRESA